MWNKYFLKAATLVGVLALALLEVTSVSAQWTEPNQNPTGGNVGPPWLDSGAVIYNPGLNERVGINDSTPAEVLEVSDVGNPSFTTRLRVTDSTSGSGNPEIQLQYSNASNNDHWSLYVDKANNNFNIWGAGTGGNNRVTVTPEGDFRISNSFEQYRYYTEQFYITFTGPQVAYIKFDTVPSAWQGAEVKVTVMHSTGSADPRGMLSKSFAWSYRLSPLTLHSYTSTVHEAWAGAGGYYRIDEAFINTSDANKVYIPVYSSGNRGALVVVEVWSNALNTYRNLAVTSPQAAAYPGRQYAQAPSPRFGVGTASPTEELDVQGDIVASGSICGNGGSNCIGGSVGGGWQDDGSVVRLITVADAVGIGTASPSAKFEVQGGNALINSGGGQTTLTLGTSIFYGSNQPQRVGINYNPGGVDGVHIGNILRPHGGITADSGNYSFATAGQSSNGLEIISGKNPGVAAFQVTEDGQPALRVDGNTNVGIGTAAPNQQLHVYRVSGNNAEIDIQSIAGAGNHWGIYHDRNTDELRFWEGGFNRVTFDNNGNIVAQGTICDSGGDNCIGAVVGGDDWTQVGSNLYPNQTTWNVGIGTTAPVSKLDVAGGYINVDSNYGYTIDDTAGTGRYVLKRGGVGVLGGTNNLMLTNRAVGGDVILGANSGFAGGELEAIRLKSGTGNVGIGTASPAQKLDVAGNIVASGTICDSSGTNCIGAGTGVAGSGTTNYLPKWTAGTSLGDSIVIQNAATNNIGVNESAPGSLLSVKGGVAIGSLQAYSRAAAPTGGMIIEGNTGIGTTAPATKLHLYDASSGPIFTLSGSTAVYRGMAVKDTSSNEQWFVGPNSSNRFVIRRSGSTDDITINSSGNVGISISGLDPGYDLVIGDTDTGFQQQGGGNMDLYVNSQQLVRFSNQQLVGIGTTVPAQKLDVAGDMTLQNNGKFGLNNDLSGQARSIKLRSNYGGDEINAGTIVYRPTWDTAVLGIVGAGTSGNREVRIWDRLGVGKNPAVELDVQGNVMISGFLQGSAVTTISTGSADVSKVPILDTDGKLDESVIPFKRGALIPLLERSIVEGAVGTASYEGDYFNIGNLSISDTVINEADNVCSGILFGPDNGIIGSAACGGAGLDDSDGDGFFDCEMTLKGNDCNDYNGSVKRDSSTWGFIDSAIGNGIPDEFNPIDRDNWLQCNANWTAQPGDYNCDLTVDKQWRSGTMSLHGTTIYEKIDDLGGCTTHFASSEACTDNQAGVACEDTGEGNNIGRCYGDAGCGFNLLPKGPYNVVCH
jgi:hypothetical protein